MRHPLKFASLLGVVLAFTACTDSPTRAITEPFGVRFTHTALNTSLDALFHDMDGLLNELYACSGAKNIDNKNSDLDKVRKYAEAGWWTAADNPQDNTGRQNVAYMVEKIISNTDGLIVKKSGGIPASCTGYYANATERDAIKTQLYFLLNVFKNQGDYSTPSGDLAAVSCETSENCEQTGNGWKIKIPAGTFNENVVVTIRPNNANPPAGFTKAPNSNSFLFDVFPSTAQANSGWTRYICWEGTLPTNEGDVDPTYVVMVREAGNGDLDYLPTVFEPWPGTTCASPNEQLGNLFVRGLRSVFAGLVLFPKDLHAYNPPRTFGGTSTASSPHWLTVVIPVAGYTLDELRDLTVEYYGENSQNVGGALTKLDAAAACASDDVECWNTALAGFQSVVNAQTKPPDNTGNKVLTYEQGTELKGIAQALMK